VIHGSVRLPPSETERKREEGERKYPKISDMYSVLIPSGSIISEMKGKHVNETPPKKVDDITSYLDIKTSEVDRMLPSPDLDHILHVLADT
jgi:hypothetical protein